MEIDSSESCTSCRPGGWLMADPAQSRRTKARAFIGTGWIRMAQQKTMKPRELRAVSEVEGFDGRALRGVRYHGPETRHSIERCTWYRRPPPS